LRDFIQSIKHFFRHEKKIPLRHAFRKKRKQKRSYDASARKMPRISFERGISIERRDFAEIMAGSGFFNFHADGIQNIQMKTSPTRNFSRPFRNNTGKSVFPRENKNRAVVFARRFYAQENPR